MFYENKEEIGGFANFFYWSSTEFDNFSAWFQFFFNGSQGTNGKGGTLYVRAVRAS